MKKILSILGLLFFIGGLALTSCNTSNRLCPAYPPSVLNGNVEQDDIQISKEIEIVELQQEKNL